MGSSGCSTGRHPRPPATRTMADQSLAMRSLRALLRRLGLGERRWIPDRALRHAHTMLVRGRLRSESSKRVTR